MLKTKIAAVVGGALVLSTISASPVLAYQQNERPAGTPPPVETVMPGRIGGDRTDRANQRQRRNQREARPAPVDPAVIRAEAQAVATAASTGCEVTEATLLGQSAEEHKIFEAACSTGPGYILVGSTPPQAVDCVQLAYQADLARNANPEAPAASPLCAIASNQDIMGVLRTFARDAGVDCEVDEAAMRGTASGGVIVYEIGCAARDGYWIEKSPSGWETTPCLKVVVQGGSCRFTDETERTATISAMLTGSEIASCNATQARFMGGNANGEFYEVKCSPEEGYIFRTNAEGAVQQTYPCADAARIGGGCQLTTVAAAAPAE